MRKTAGTLKQEIETMLLGPFFVAELTTAARRRRYFWLRALYALCLLLFLGLRYLAATQPRGAPTTIGGIAELANDFFMGFTGVQVLAIYLFLPAMMAGAIAQERERRTIEYLLTSRLSASDIILGKLGARLWQTVNLLMSGFGILAILQLMGGVSARELLWAFGGSLVLMIEVGGITMLISTWTKRSRDALRNTYVILFAWSILPVWISEVFSRSGTLFMEIAVALTPWSVLSASFDYQTTRSPFTLATWHLLLGIGCIAASIVSLRPAYRRSDVVISAKRTTKSKEATRRRQIGDRPMHWKETPSTRRGQWLCVVLAIAGGITPWSVYGGYPPTRVPMGLIVFLDITMTFSLILIAVRAATVITSEKERECWPILVSTILPAEDILRSKAWGAIWSARPLIYCIGAALLACLLQFNGATKFVLIMATMFVGYSAFCAMLGLRMSLTSSNSVSAIGKTMAVLFVSNAAFMGFGMLVFSTNTLAEPKWLWIVCPCIPFAIAFVGDTLFETSSRYVISTILSIFVSTAGYSLVAAMLFASCRISFDRLAGRIVSRVPRG